MENTGSGWKNGNSFFAIFESAINPWEYFVMIIVGYVERLYSENSLFYLKFNKCVLRK